MNAAQRVFIVDDDAGFRKSLSLLLRSENLSTETFGSAQSFLDAYDASLQGCLVLDFRMPGMSGLELQERLVGLGALLPIIMVTAHADVKTAVSTMKLGSFDLIEKPYKTGHLIERINDALKEDQRARAHRASGQLMRERLETLTPREKEVLVLVVAGGTSKAIADQLQVSVSTVDNHRAKIMKKLQAGTAADVVRIALAGDPDLLQENLPRADDEGSGHGERE